MLKAALQYLRDCLPPLLAQKTANKRMDAAQKIYWYAVAQVLANDAPTSVADLAALALALLDGIAVDIRCDNDDGFRAFWSEGRRESRRSRRMLDPLERQRLFVRVLDVTWPG